jgi:hypothetical protein
VVSGRARISEDPGADSVGTYIEKYEQRISRNGWTPAAFAADYSVPIRVDVTRISGH